MLAEALLQDKCVYLIRHCQAEGQDSDAPLTETGRQQAEVLAAFFQELTVDAIVTSPYLRAIDTAVPLAKGKAIDFRIDDRLSERVLSALPITDWRNVLKETFVDHDLVYAGGESSREATARGIHALTAALQSVPSSVAIVTHGNLFTLMLQAFDSSYGYKEWSTLSNPDVYKLWLPNQTVQIERLWKEEKRA
ncbi:histidine phosphatase family protein [Aureibacillus halotolerans]|uniref:2,3-bisphosphoglycerate-dependent phosphoglycerate mutase n=1 Tax=Aureibacillus halotolerans TaxID=1508390 RepID=A0A4R6TSG3_9BACI|nr:histidine phosphatase family protein [Aureibacillus halotolerans]TDQ36568.1 2,3-bisphosphoglycerate-dependent phosphoglycerate mutase [Aureibacillus halotolerans]